jgi:PAS domain S-box-containing protein
MAINIDSNFNYFEALFHNAQENTVLLMDNTGSITAVNTAFTECFGYKQNDIIGKNLSILFTEEDQKNGKPENEVKTVLRKGQCSDNNYLVKKNKDIIWVSGESLLVKNEEGTISILKIIQNINKQKLSEHELERSTDFNENILKSIEDAVIVLDEKINIKQSNNAFNRLFGITTTDTSSLNFKDLIQPYDVNNYLLTKVQKAISVKQGFSNNQITINFISAGQRIFDVSCIPLQTAGTNNVILVLHDITVHKQVEREREDIIGFVAHELRNPLANVVLCNEIMSDAINDNNLVVVRNILERSKNNVMRLNKMIAELYDAAKVNSGNLKLEISEFNFEDMLKEAVETIEVLQPSYHIIVKGSASIQVIADRHRLIQVITNYLSNGIKYSNGRTNVTLSVEHDESTLTVSVRDEGLGISQAQLPYIFQRFFRAEKTRNLEGIGLGLYLCHQIIQAHNGDVWAESEEGKGSTFYFSIPLSSDADAKNGISLKQIM